MEKISCLIVTYNPDYNRLGEVLNSVVRQVDSIVIVDNSTNTLLKPYLERLNNLHIHMVILADNYGIAYAQNIGIDYIIEHGLGEYILF